MHFRDWKSRVIHHTTERISSTSMIKGFHLLFGSVVQVLTNSAVPVSFPFPVPLSLLQCQVFIREKMPISLNFLRELRVLLERVFQKRFLKYPYSV